MANFTLKGQTYTLPDGRQLGYCTVGEGQPVVYFHGTAISRLEVLLLEKFAFATHAQLIGVDRPGFGLSTFSPITDFHGFANDVDLLVEHMQFDQFSVIGWSGGGAFALAYVALFPERVRKSVVVAAPALPFDVATAHNNSLARFVMKIPYFGMLALGRMRSKILKANKDINGFLSSKEGKNLLKSCSVEDAKFFSDKKWVTLLYQSMAEAFRQGNQSLKAILKEHMLFMKPWGVPISRIPPDKVFIWQGNDDKTCCVYNAFRLANDIPNANVEIFDGKGHCVLFENLEKLSVLFG